MQRVFRLSLAGLLAFAGASLTACGDKVTVPPAVPVDSTIHTVTVSPQNTSVAVGGTTQLAASVDAGAGAKNRTVTWTSSDAATAMVDQTGKVTGVKGGSVTIIAKAVADPTVQGAASITVTGGGVPTVTIQSIVQTFGGTSSAADLSNAKGQLDITLNVEPNGQIIKTVTATITCGAKSKSASQTISDVAPSGVYSVGGSDHAQHQHRRVQRDDGRAGPEQRRLRADGRCDDGHGHADGGEQHAADAQQHGRRHRQDHEQWQLGGGRERCLLEVGQHHRCGDASSVQRHDDREREHHAARCCNADADRSDADGWRCVGDVVGRLRHDRHRTSRV